MKLGMNFHKSFVHIATEGYVCKICVNKLLQPIKKKKTNFFFAPNMNLFKLAFKNVLNFCIDTKKCFTQIL